MQSKVELCLLVLLLLVMRFPEVERNVLVSDHMLYLKAAQKASHEDEVSQQQRPVNVNVSCFKV